MKEITLYFYRKNILSYKLQGKTDLVRSDLLSAREISSLSQIVGTFAWDHINPWCILSNQSVGLSR